MFSTLEAAQQFLQDPKNHINTVLSLLREKPHLINFLQAKQLLMEVRDILKYEIRFIQGVSYKHVILV